MEEWSTFVTISDVLCSRLFLYIHLLLLEGIFEYIVVCESATCQPPYWIFEVILCYRTFSATFVPEYDSSSISPLPNYLYTISLMPFFPGCRNFLFMEPFSLYHMFLYFSFSLCFTNSNFTETELFWWPFVVLKLWLSSASINVTSVLESTRVSF